MMFGLLIDLWNLLWQKTERKVLLIGLDNAGKTSTLEALKKIFLQKSVPSYNQIVPTVGLNIATIPINSETTVLLWDVGGQELLRRLWSSYYKAADGVLFVIDATDRARIPDAVATLKQMIMYDVTTTKRGN
eukprot:GHVH01000969.1.p1 GENE.GHVH01000969.1~~GHVH01000969.1.p1  ORF type:complete len:132 (+),score=17.55 GHVH01000969.1:25-420(+)